MRIISGTKGGIIIHAPAKLPVRPTTDYAKTGIFNILNNHFDFEEISVLDLFSGTGNISYEFASRGCRDIYCVDTSASCVNFIRETSLKLGFDGIRTIKSDVFRFLKSPQRKFDIVFADPPFDMKESADIPDLVFQGDWLKEDGWLIFEHQSKFQLINTKNLKETRHYGNCAFSIFTSGDTH
ncbi:MAG: methyltransferase domain-containing protein [Bacteroidetes bacterium]|nr:MAG: methyltransferase domain-containing protein [Bacteroidota bacterium]REK00357.1 MAG: methyltransferase domain-containing protein [Bacteroidota bacterium]REK35476.1 MAG: methyltransferase domain-containing protein [Bacteroidota bacterium]REK46840.1 MAG: methyltransferase domain-containing protein [Bacteroidota bacterium]